MLRLPTTADNNGTNGELINHAKGITSPVPQPVIRHASLQGRLCYTKYEDRDQYYWLLSIKSGKK